MWAPPMGAITEDPTQGGAVGGYMKETSFVSFENRGNFFLQKYSKFFFVLQGEAPPPYTEQSQMQQSNTVNYGATGHVANNPFAMAGATIAEESMQPDVAGGLATGSSYATYDYTAGQGTATAPAMGQLPQMPSYEQQYPQYQTQ